MTYDENAMSTREFWKERDARLEADANLVQEVANSPEGRLEAAERKLRAMHYDRGAYTDDQVKEQQGKVREIEAEIRAAQEARFAAEWTLEVTKARRAEWNAWARSLTGPISNAELLSQEEKFGFTFRDMKKAIKLHRL